MDSTGQLCARARFWASLRIDDELSELEGALLDAHLARCAECRAVAGDFAVLTGDLRGRTLERGRPVVIRAGRPARRAAVGATVAALIAAAVVLGGLVRGQVSNDAAVTPHAVAVVASLETPDQLRKLRRTTLLDQRYIPRDLAAPV
jgi:hypothetical protein